MDSLARRGEVGPAGVGMDQTIPTSKEFDMSAEEVNTEAGFVELHDYADYLNNASKNLAESCPEDVIPDILIKLLSVFSHAQAHLYSDDVKEQVAYELDRLSLFLKLPEVFPCGNGKPPTFVMGIAHASRTQPDTGGTDEQPDSGN